MADSAVGAMFEHLLNENQMRIKEGEAIADILEEMERRNRLVIEVLTILVVKQARQAGQEDEAQKLLDTLAAIKEES